MKFDLSTFIFKKLGLNESASIALEAIIYSIILLFFLIIIWIVGRKILTVLFVKVSKLTKTKFDDLLIKNKIPSTLAYFPPILLSIRLFPIILSDIKVISGPIILLMDLLLTLLVISIIRRVLNTLKDFLKTIPNFRDKPIDSYIHASFTATNPLAEITHKRRLSALGPVFNQNIGTWDTSKVTWIYHFW